MMPWPSVTERLAARCDALCFGTLGQRSDESRQVIQQFLAAAAPVAYRVLDVNLRPPFVDEGIIESIKKNYLFDQLTFMLS